jgi:hypothetical protein
VVIVLARLDTARSIATMYSADVTSIQHINSNYFDVEKINRSAAISSPALLSQSMSADQRETHSSLFVGVLPFR